MSLEILNGLAHLSNENELLYHIDFKQLIKDFALRKLEK